MKTNHIIPLIFVALFIMGLAACEGPRNSNYGVTTSTEDLQVLEETLNRQAVNYLFPESKAFFVFDKTNDFVWSRSVLQDFAIPGLKDETITNYLTNNQEIYSVSDSLDLNKEIILTNLTELREQYKIDDAQIAYELDWEKIREDYSQIAGIIHLSKIGFDNAQEQALVTITYNDVKNIVCFDFYIILLARPAEGWEVKESFHIDMCG